MRTGRDCCALVRDKTTGRRRRCKLRAWADGYCLLHNRFKREGKYVEDAVPPDIMRKTP